MCGGHLYGMAGWGHGALLDVGNQELSLGNL